MLVSTQLTLVDFSEERAIRNWRMTNDNVMGGVSTASLERDENGFGVFSGRVSTANNGGFAMTRLPLKIMFNETFKTIKLKVKGDGKKYQFRIKSNSPQRYWYVQSFQTSNEWEEISLPLDAFYPSYRGYRLNQENFSDNTIRDIAILIGNKVDENCELMIDTIVLE